MPLKDEVLIKLRDSMNEREIADELEKVSNVLHRIVQISINAGARAHLTYFSHLINAAGAVEASHFVLSQGGLNAKGGSPIVRPQ